MGRGHGVYRADLRGGNGHANRFYFACSPVRLFACIVILSLLGVGISPVIGMVEKRLLGARIWPEQQPDFGCRSNEEHFLIHRK